MNTDPRKSAMPCGCDEGGFWTCEQHRGPARIVKNSDGGEILVHTPVSLQGATVIHKDPQTDIAFEDDAKYRALYGGPDIAPASLFPHSAAGRKAHPVFTGFLMYFPDAVAAVARVSKKGNDQHNPGQPLHWAREKSTDQMDTATRHMMDHGTGVTLDSDGEYHLAKAMWRIAAELQLTIERDKLEGRFVHQEG